jgi:anthranilate phosphoribosyltransferase
MQEFLNRLVRGEDLGEEDAARAMQLIFEGEATAVQIAGFIVALRVKGETVEELTGFARAARAMATPIAAPDGLLDTCGTGGDGLHTFNISTLSAIVAAAGGARVAKHGNRAVSSACGSADVLEALGVKIDLGPDGVVRCLEEAGIGFLFAPLFHPSFRHASQPRKDLGVRTVFNVLGPLCNPAGARRQALGVADGALAGKMAACLERLGVQRALVFHGCDGMDELSLSGPSRVLDVSPAGIREYEIQPSELGLEHAPADALRSGDAAWNAELARRLLAGEAGPRRDAVLLNAAAALQAAGLAGDFREGIAGAARAIDSGAAAAVLERWVRVSQAAAVPA